MNTATISPPTAAPPKTNKLEILLEMRQRAHAAEALAQKAFIYCQIGWLWPEKEAEALKLYASAKSIISALSKQYDAFLKDNRGKPLSQGCKKQDKHLVISVNNDVDRDINHTQKILTDTWRRIADNPHIKTPRKSEKEDNYE